MFDPCGIGFLSMTISYLCINPESKALRQRLIRFDYSVITLPTALHHLRHCEEHSDVAIQGIPETPGFTHHPYPSLFPLSLLQQP